jgi:hypothetical protein
MVEHDRTPSFSRLEDEAGAADIEAIRIFQQ